MFGGMGFAHTLVARLRETESMISHLVKGQRRIRREPLPDVELLEWERRRAVREEAHRRRWEAR
jgi:hypothetical protein